MTPVIILLTVVVSVAAFYQSDVMTRLQFNAYRVYHHNEYHRMVTHAFLHGNWEHLLINMLVFWSFGTSVERFFRLNFGSVGSYYFLLLYFGAVIFSSLWSLVRHKNNYYYNAVGASGGVSAILFAAIFFSPWSKIYFFGLLPIPGIVFALGYLYYSYRMSLRARDNIGHEAHFTGALFGFVLPILLRPSLFMDFINKLF